jgi:integrase
MFRWGVAQELLPFASYGALAAVPGLKRGRTVARESMPILPVDEATITATLKHLPQVVADMVRLQRLVGCRPGEVCNLRPCDVDASRGIWVYTPLSHKTQHHGRTRRIFIGPHAQDILRPYLNRPQESYCFSPSDSERKRRFEMRNRRRTSFNPSRRNVRKLKLRRPPTDRYTKDSYCRAIARACEIAFGMSKELRCISIKLSEDEKSRLRAQAAAWRSQHVWSPNQLRHAAATEIRNRYGIEAARVALGHTTVACTELYAERDFTLAARVASEIG